MKKMLLVVLLLSPVLFAEMGLIPLPNECEMLSGSLKLTPTSTISYADDEARETAEMLAEWLRPATDYALLVHRGKAGTIVLDCVQDDALGQEGYRLDVTDRAVVTAATAAGLFYGAQTIRQLLGAEIFSPEKVSADWQIPHVTICDTPRFKWRGMHLDVGRHFFPIEDIKKFIDVMAMHKLNSFHWHLSEDQGWRIEIKQYPKLTTVGAYRASTPPYGNRLGSDGQRYGGYYTQQQVRDLVAYAAERHITIVPEIDMPGHMAAAIAAYPEFGCFDVEGYAPEVQTRWGVFPYVLSPSEETFEFVDNVLDEICRLFPSKYIHIGGDEAPKEHWKASKIAQDVMKREGLTTEHDLQSYFIGRVEKMLEKRGRCLIGWDEIREGGLSPKATVMSWRGVQGGVDSAKEGHDVVMAPGSHTYFDHYQDTEEKELAKGKAFEAIGGYLPISKVYGFDPVVPGSLSAEEQKHVLGVQAQLWTEYMKNWDKVEYMAFPRMAALAEVAWTQPQNKDYAGFTARLVPMRKRYEKIGLNAYDGDIPTPPKTLKGVSVSTSLPHYNQYQAELVYDGNPDTFFWSSRSPQAGDYFSCSFAAPLSERMVVSVVTGGAGQKASDRVEQGVLEVSKDGRQWQKIADFHDGRAVGEAAVGTSQIRIAFTGSQSKWLILNDVRVTPVKPG